MPKKIGKIFSSAKSKILGGSSPSKKALASSSSASSSTLAPSISSEAGGTFATDTEPILGPSTSRDSIGSTAPTVEAHSRSSSVASGSRGTAPRSKGSSKSASADRLAEEGRGKADGAEEKTLGQDGTPRTVRAQGDLSATEGGALGGLRRFFNFGAPLTASSGYNELYTEQKDLHSAGGWWHSTFQLGASVPVLFGTWDGVFITCVVHLFGVLSFLRIGWLVGHEGLLLGSGIVFGCLLFNAISLLAAIGIMERCAAASSAGAAAAAGILGNYRHPGGEDGAGRGSSGGMHQFDPEYPSTVASARANVHLLISTVLGSRIGGAISLIYCFGQAVSCALHCVGFTETFVQIVAVFIERHVAVPASESTWICAFAHKLASFLLIDITMTPDPSGKQVATLLLSPYTYQIVSALAIGLLFLINILGVKILFRLQSFLFISLVMAVLDFASGLVMTHDDYGYGQIVANLTHLESNLYPNTSATSTQFWSQLFLVIGVFFPSSIGVMAGVNMGSDLKTPTRSIPMGSLSAIFSSYLLHLLFIIGLGLTCTRASLLNDFTISQHVSALGFFLLTGVYMSALSSSLGSMYTAPRILQNLAQELHSFPIVRCFASGRGPNKIPINALILFTLVTLTFVMIGGINVLAPIVTIPYLLTYATIEYAYFSMAMTFDIQINREKRFMAIASQLPTNGTGSSSPEVYGTKMIVSVASRAGSQKSLNTTHRSPPASETTGLTDGSSVSHLKIDDLNGADVNGAVPPSPTPSMQHLVGYGSVQGATQHIKIKRRQSTKSDSESDDELAAFSMARYKASSTTSRGRHASGTFAGVLEDKLNNVPGAKNSPPPPVEAKKKAKTIKQLMAAESDEDSEEDGADQEVLLSSNGDLNKRSVFRFETSDLNRYSTTPEPEPKSTALLEQGGAGEPGPGDRLLAADPELAEIACKEEIWYLRLMNRWIVLVAALCKLGLMFFIAWHYALLTLGAFLLFIFIIGKTNPGFYPGVSEFALLAWIKNFAGKLFRRKTYLNGAMTPNLTASYSYDRIVLPPTSIPNLNYQSEQLTHENADYSSRQSFHGSTMINPSFNQ